MTTTYDWLTDTTTVASVNSVDLLSAVTRPFVVITTLVRTPDYGSAGIKVTDGTNSLFFSFGPLEGANVITIPASVGYIAVQWSSGATYTPFFSTDGIDWQPWVMPADVDGNPLPYPSFPTTPTQAGMFLSTGSTTLEETVEFGSARVLSGVLLVADVDTPGLWQIPSEEEMVSPIGTLPSTQPDLVTSSEEAIIHALVGAPFGDLEFDVGKSVGWLSRFVDDLFVTDLNSGDQRYWVVNWTQSFQHTYYKFSGKNFFVDPVAYRKGQLADAFQYAADHPDVLTYDDTDWVIFLDAHEGLSTNTTSKPNDYLIAPYKSFIYREIARANAAGRDRIILPFFAFLRHDHIQNVSQSYEFEGESFTVTQAAGVPYYLPYQGLTRMFKVSALKNPAFDWSILDKSVAVVDANVKIQLVSYAYAHWCLQDIPPGEVRVPPLSASNDDGWKQRCSISQVLPITGLPFGNPVDPVGTWVSPTADVTGVRGPWAFDTYADKVTDPVIPDPPSLPIDPSVAGILTPMYDLVFRLNVRDGVWYGVGGLGNTQLVWNDDLQEFIEYGQPVPST